jgi:selenocysteine lyase/cysteine desulfurase
LYAATHVQQALAAQHINVSVSRTGSSRFDFERRGLSEVVRASVHCYTTEEELQRLLDALGELPGAKAA